METVTLKIDTNTKLYVKPSLAWRDYKESVWWNINITLFFFKYNFVISFDTLQCQWWFHSMLSDMTFLLLLVGLKRSFGLIGESAITLHMQYNQSGTGAGYRNDIGYSVKEALLCFAIPALI